jgi:hypothetical protein
MMIRIWLGAVAVFVPWFEFSDLDEEGGHLGFVAVSGSSLGVAFVPSAEQAAGLPAA